jgi:hypothetical protein
LAAPRPLNGKALAGQEARVTQVSLSEYPIKVFEACDAAMKAGELKADPPPVIFHLTDAEALSKILTTQSLWASLATTLNDSLEVRHAINVAVRLLEDRMRTRLTIYDSALHQFLLDPSAVPQGVRYEIDPFVVSFCGRPEKSGQWLHYGRSGRGVALGVSASIAQTVKYSLIRIDYTIHSQRERILRFVEARAATIKAAGLSREDERQVALARTTAHIVSLYIRLLAAGIKHPSFSDEDEWRLLAYDVSNEGNSLIKNRPIEFRNAGDQIIPYETLDFADDCANLIKEVIVGHASSLSEDAVRLLAREKGINIAVSRSEVPVR